MPVRADAQVLPNVCIPHITAIAASALPPAGPWLPSTNTSSRPAAATTQTGALFRTAGVLTERWMNRVDAYRTICPARQMKLLRYNPVRLVRAPRPANWLWKSRSSCRKAMVADSDEVAR